MLLYKLLVLVVTGRCCLASNDMLEVVAAQGKTATLPCPHEKGDVVWTCFINGQQVPLVSGRYSSTTNNALVISKVESSDERLYLCNKKPTVFLKVLRVTTDPNIVDPGDDSQVLVPGSNHTETQQPSDWWKIPVGVVIGSALVLLAVVSSAKRQPDMEEVATEVVYREIRENLGQDLLRHDSECVYSLIRNRRKPVIDRTHL